MNAGTRKMHVLLPNEVVGYAFDPGYSWWSTIVAEESTNLIVNPSFESLNDLDIATEYDEGGSLTSLDYIEFPDVGAIAGKRCARLISGAGSGWITYDEGLAVTPGLYTFSCDIYVTRVPFTIYLAITGTGGATTYTSSSFRVLESGWNRYSISYAELGSGNRECRLTLVNTNPSGVTVYTDAWQFERKGYSTTYLDGDMLGFNDDRPYSSYYWHGAPHASISTRRANTGSGGRLVSWSDKIGFNTTSIVGLSMAPVEQASQTLGNGKRVHLGVKTLSRDFTITGRLFGIDIQQLLDRHSTLRNLLRPNNTSIGDQMILRYQNVDSADHPVGMPLDIICVYRDGLQGSISNLYQQSVALQFSAAQPYPIEIVERSAELTMVEELVSNMIVYRDEHGEFFNLGTGTTTGGVVHRAGFLADGRIVAFGNYTQIAGVVANFGAVWTGTTWEEIADTDAGVTDIDDGFKLGYSLTVGTSGGDVIEYDALSGIWDVLGDGFLGAINAIQRDENGDIWVAGQFEFAQDGITVFNNVAKWSAADATWEQLGEGLTDPGNLNPATLEATTVLVTNDGNVYFGGTFEQGDSGATTTLANAVIYWDIAAQVYRGMGSGLNEAPTQMIQGQDGYIYAVGPFDQNGYETYDLRGFARWNGYSWEEVFALIKPGGAFGADGIIQDEEGIFWFYNNISDPVNDLFIVEGLGNVPFFGWRNGVIYPPYMADASIRHMAIGPGDRIIHVTDPYVGAGTPTKVPAMTRVTYTGSADAPMIVHLQGPGRVNQIRNRSTEGGVYARENFLMSANESVFMRGDTQRTLIYSNQRRNLYGRLLGGATNIAALRLIPGENHISLFVTETEVDVSQAWLTWKNRVWGIGESGR